MMKSPFLNVFLFSFFWALDIFVSKLAFEQGASPFLFMVQSLVFMFIFLSIFIFPYFWKEIKGYTKKTWGLLTLATVVHTGIGVSFSMWGTSLTTLINAGVLVKFSTVATIFIAAVLLKEKLTLQKILISLVMIFGVFLLSTNGTFEGFNIGDVFILVACFCWSFGNVLIGLLVKEYPISSEMIAFFRPLIAIPVILLISLLLATLFPSANVAFSVNIFDMNYIWYAMINGIFIALLVIFLNRTMKFASASYMSIMSMMTPIIVSILGIYYFKRTTFIYSDDRSIYYFIFWNTVCFRSKRKIVISANTILNYST